MPIFFWIFLVGELFAFVQIGRGLWGELGGDQIARLEKLNANIAKRQEQAQQLLAVGNAEEAERKLNIAENLKKVASKVQEAAEAAASEGLSILITGIVLLLVIKLIEGFYANLIYERQYLRWRANPKIQSGTDLRSAVVGVFLIIAVWPLTLFRFTVAEPEKILSNLFL